MIDELLALEDPSEGTLDELAQRVVEIEAAIELLRDLRAVVAADVLARMESDNVAVPYVGMLNRVPTSSSTWKDKRASNDFRKDVFEAIVDEVALDRVTGERDMLRANVARMVMREVDAALPAFTSLKAAGRDRLRIDVKQYREYSDDFKLVIEPIGGTDHE